MFITAPPQTPVGPKRSVRICSMGSSICTRALATASTSSVGILNYSIERCQGAGCSTFVQIGTAISTNYSDTGLTPLTAYTYRVRASNVLGDSAKAAALLLLLRRGAELLDRFRRFVMPLQADFVHHAGGGAGDEFREGAIDANTSSAAAPSSDPANLNRSALANTRRSFPHSSLVTYLKPCLTSASSMVRSKNDCRNPVVKMTVA